MNKRKPTFGVRAVNRTETRLVTGVLLFVVALYVWSNPTMAAGQGATGDDTAAAKSDPAGESDLATQKASDALKESAEGDSPARSADGAAEEPSINLLQLAITAGWLMIPILLLSVVVLMFGVERWLGLRRAKIMPDALVEELGRLAASRGQFDPRAAYHVCQRYPSTAATIVRAMLLKVGRPHAEVERAVADVSQREADRLYSNVRTLNLAAAISPLLGLLGTVWGMIKSFYSTANMPLGTDKAEVLASGIYTALMTTFAGLAVAIPAVVLAHHFEGRIQRLLREIEELVSGLLPQVERYEGKLRVSRTQLGGEGAAKPAASEEEPTAAK